MAITYEPGEAMVAVLPISRIQDVLLTRLVAREQATRLGFHARALTQIATAVSEMVRNVVQHAGASGQCAIFQITDSGRVGLRIQVADTGKGIANLTQALAGVSAGAGIPGCRTLMDEFSVKSAVGSGTTVTMLKWL